MRKIRKKFFLSLSLSLVTIILTILWALVIGFLKDYKNIPNDHLIGNREENVVKIKNQGFPFSFVVIGDTYSSENAETLIELATKEEKPSFMVILGDFVKKPDIWKHRFFLTEMASEMRPSSPVFLVSGNHDIDFGLRIKNKERRVTPEVFKSLYGAMNFDFVFGESLFIICGVDPNYPDSYLNYLREVLSKKGNGQKYIFVFVHYPPKGLADYIGGSLPRGEDFLSILKTHKVTACFFGDYHGYWRGQYNGINLIVTGGGGRLKKSQPRWGKFYHILKITVDKDKLSEEVLTIQERFGLEDRFEDFAFYNIFPILGTSLIIYYLIFAGFFLLAGYSILKFLRASS